MQQTARRNLDFNSTIVRLIAFIDGTHVPAVAGFQFYNSAINRVVDPALILGAAPFQFYNSAINSR